MYAHELAHPRTRTHLRSAQPIDMPIWGMRDMDAAGRGTDLRTRSTPFFRGALAHLILAAAQVQRAGGVQHIALRRHAVPSPHVLFTARLDGCEMAFATHVGDDGQAHVVQALHGASGRPPSVQRRELGAFESSRALMAHREAVAEFLAALRPTLALDADGAGLVAGLPTDPRVSDGDEDIGLDALPGQDGCRARRSYDAAFAAFGMLPQG